MTDKLQQFAEKMGYNSKWKMIKNFAIDIAFLAILIYFGLVISDMNVTCEPLTVGTETNWTEIINITLPDNYSMPTRPFQKTVSV